MIGSTWNKWDLHIHCPTSVFNNQFKGSTEEEKWEKFLTDVEKHTDVLAMGVTDYFSIDGYKKLKNFKAQGRIPNIKFIVPNVELRLTPVTGKKKKLNLHILFDPIVEEYLERHFFSELSFQYGNREYKLIEEDLIELGRKYTKDSTLSNKAAYKIGLQQFSTDVRCLREIFKTHPHIRKGAIIGVANSSTDGASGIVAHMDSLQAMREDIYYFSDLIFSSFEKDRTYFLGEGSIDNKDIVVKKYGGLMPCIHGCDAHSNEKIFKPDLERFTWIKAEPSFEGLRQIIFEPEHRVKIQPISPPLPIHRIKEVKLNFPDDAKIGEDPFCLAGERSLKFSPFYTCIIGGRGVGKSMLLNLIHESLYPDNNEEIKKINQRGLLNENGEKLKVQEHVHIDGDAEEKYIEFFSQNEIEEFALDYSKLTNAIYQRLLKRDSEGELQTLEEYLGKALIKHEKYVNALLTRSHLLKEKSKLEREGESLKNIIDTFSGKEYQNIEANLKNYRDKLEKFDLAKEAYDSLLGKLESLRSEHQTFSDNENELKNPYYAKINEAFKLIQEAVKVMDSLDETSLDKEKTTLEQGYAAFKDQLRQLLVKQNLPEESINEVTTANERLSSNKAQLRELSQKLKEKNDFIEGYEISELEAASKGFHEKVNQFITETSKKLGELESEFVKPITLDLDFNFSMAQEAIFKRFKEVFSDHIEKAELRGEHYLKENLFSKSLDKIWESGEKKTIVEGIENNPTSSKAKPFLLELFESKENLDLFFEIIRRECLNIPSFKQITVRYDHKQLEDSSFGQRCTAALVTLIVLGNTPIIIDEPEAHLDSLLISNFLVEVIKKQKQHRQIIFATHNANFVINADADLIHILSMDENNVTQIKSTTIENLETREKLISLEGGKKAFKSRENRYSIS